MVLVDPKVMTIKIPYGSTSPLPLRLHPVKPPSQVTASEGALGSSLAAPWQKNTTFVVFLYGTFAWGFGFRKHFHIPL